jgi:anionic cell wall polymer biosynthesis LytR-Cps2A-Psr (LCP) family protein
MKSIKKIALILLVSLFIAIFILFIIFVNISRLSGLSASYLYNNIVKEFFKPSSKPGTYNFLILGLDKRDDTLEKTETTDTIIFASYNLKLNKLFLVSYPRDLWDYYLNSKINDIYPQSLKTNDKYSFISTKYTQIIGQKIDRVIVINTQNLIDFINFIGGVDVYLKQGFIDHQYPNPEYIKNPLPPIPIYITVSYPPGWNHLDKTNITPFVRSRKSSDTAKDGGTDLGRIERQQLLIESLSQKLNTNYFIANIGKLFTIYKYWKTNIETNLSDKDLTNLFANSYKQLPNLVLTKIEIPVGLNSKDGLIYHPVSFINNQWVFIPNDNDYRQLQLYVDNLLNK